MGMSIDAAFSFLEKKANENNCRFDAGKANEIKIALGYLAHNDMVDDEYLDNTAFTRLQKEIGSNYTADYVLERIHALKTANAEVRTQLKQPFGLMQPVDTNTIMPTNNLDLNNFETNTILNQFGLQSDRIKEAGFTKMEIIYNSDGTPQLKLSNPEGGYSVTVNRTADNENLEIAKTENGLSINGGDPDIYVKLDLDEKSTMKDIEFSMCSMHIEDNSPTEGMRIIEKGFEKWNGNYNNTSCGTVEYKNLAGKGLDKNQKNVVCYYRCDKNGELWNRNTSISQEGLLLERVPLFMAETGCFSHFVDKNDPVAVKLLEQEKASSSTYTIGNASEGDATHDLNISNGNYVGGNVYGNGRLYYSKELGFQIGDETGNLTFVAPREGIYTKEAYKKAVTNGTLVANTVYTNYIKNLEYQQDRERTKN